ncbi:MAG: phage tail protein [Nocardioidaceae bacterium]|nr:phage tail protein [Nocardioidaceae bacterium]
MTDPFLAEIRMFAGNFAPSGWALCNGQLMSISQNTALFSLLGTTYGGDGRVTFGLPDLQGSMPMQQGQGPALSQRYLGEQAGEPTVTLLTSEMPSHTHTVKASSDTQVVASPIGHVWGEPALGRVTTPVYATGAATTTMSPLASGLSGGGQPHENMPPYVVGTFIIALQGIFPQRP